MQIKLVSTRVTQSEEIAPQLDLKEKLSYFFFLSITSPSPRPTPNMDILKSLAHIIIGAYTLPLTLYHFIFRIVPNLSTFPFILLVSTLLCLIYGLGDICTIEKNIGCESFYITDFFLFFLNQYCLSSTHMWKIKYGCKSLDIFS